MLASISGNFETLTGSADVRLLFYAAAVFWWRMLIVDPKFFFDIRKRTNDAHIEKERVPRNADKVWAGRGGLGESSTQLLYPCADLRQKFFALLNCCKIYKRPKLYSHFNSMWWIFSTSTKGSGVRISEFLANVIRTCSLVSPSPKSLTSRSERRPQRLFFSYLVHHPTMIS